MVGLKRIGKEVEQEGSTTKPVKPSYFEFEVDLAGTKISTQPVSIRPVPAILVSTFSVRTRNLQITFDDKAMEVDEVKHLESEESADDRQNQ